MSNQLLFFFSAIGAFNGLFLSFYCAIFSKHKNKATYFLAALLFVISVRVTKSVFLSFYPQTSSLFIQVGLTACFLIGPLLYLYTKKTMQPQSFRNYNWLLHIIPAVLFMIIIGVLYPYRSHWQLWSRRGGGVLGWILFAQWSTYIFTSIYLIRSLIPALFSKNQKLTNQNIWLLNVVFGTTLIWFFYQVAYYTSYIVGAISFSFTLYLSIVLWFFRKKKASIFEPQVKYANKKIDHQEASDIAEGLKAFMKTERYRNPNIKLAEVAATLAVSSHSLSQYLNDNLEKSFSSYINEHRILAAAKMLKENNLLTIEAIGQECGFKSNSTFYAAFKAVKGVTPAQFKKSHA